jgi:hypothetical protein
MLDHVRTAPAPNIVRADPAAQAILDAFAEESADGRETDGRWATVKSFAARLAENAWRIALTLHAIQRGPDCSGIPISAGTATAAVSLTRWFFTETLELLKPAQAKRRQSRMERLLEIFKMKQASQLALSLLREHHGYGEHELLELSAAFPVHLKLKTTTSGPQGGRTSKVALVSPFPAE